MGMCSLHGRKRSQLPIGSLTCHMYSLMRKEKPTLSIGSLEHVQFTWRKRSQLNTHDFTITLTHPITVLISFCLPLFTLYSPLNYSFLIHFYSACTGSCMRLSFNTATGFIFIVSHLQWFIQQCYKVLNNNSSYVGISILCSSSGEKNVSHNIATSLLCSNSGGNVYHTYMHM